MAAVTLIFALLPASYVAAEPRPTSAAEDFEVSTSAASSPTPGGPEAQGLDTYSSGKGFKLIDTPEGDLSISFYLMARYINQLPSGATFTDHNGVVQNITTRNDIFAPHRALIFFDGWVFDRSLTYNATVWEVTASGIIYLIGSLNYKVSPELTLSAGVNGLPGTRTLNNSHPYWLGTDRVMADDFFRPGFTSGVWASGSFLPKTYYIVMVGNLLSQVNVTAAQNTRALATAATFCWMPTTGEFGPRGAFGDYERHRELATRVGASFTHSYENRFNELAQNTPENQQLRLADSLLLFQTGALAPGVTINDADFQLVAVDAGAKKNGWFVQSEGYWRHLSSFNADGPTPSQVVDTGFYFEVAKRLRHPEWLELYLATDWVFGDHSLGFRTSHDVIGGANFYPWHTRNARFNIQIIGVSGSPASSAFGFYTGGLHGTIASASWMLLI
jgi:hypothetical protein